MTPLRTALIQHVQGSAGHFCPSCWATKSELHRLTFVEQASTPGPDRYLCETCGQESVCDHTTDGRAG